MMSRTFIILFVILIVLSLPATLTADQLLETQFGGR